MGRSSLTSVERRVALRGMVERFVAVEVDREAAIRIVALDNGMLAEDVAAIVGEAETRGEVHHVAS